MKELDYALNLRDPVISHPDLNNSRHRDLRCNDAMPAGIGWSSAVSLGHR